MVGRFVDAAACLPDVCEGPVAPSGLDDQALAVYEEDRPTCRASRAELVRVGSGERMLPANCPWTVRGRCGLLAGEAAVLLYVGEGRRRAITAETYVDRLTDSFPQAVVVAKQLQALKQGDARE